MNPFKKVMQSRWAWGMSGLPSLARARALFLARRHTMTSAVRCRVLWNLCQQVLQAGTPGCFVECGVWKGGSAAIMALATRHAGEHRALHLFDSFEGLPEPDVNDGLMAASYSKGRSGGALTSIHECEAGLSEVRKFLLGELRVPDSQVSFHAGWFQDTVPKAAPALQPIAVLRLDGDWYDSTRVCLEHLYPLVSPGGPVFLDDYFCWEGCQKATDEYRAEHGISDPIIRVDIDSGYWIKS